MEMLAELLSLISKNSWAAGMLSMLITALSGMLSYLLKERGRRRMKRYELTIEHYNDYSCLMFTAMDALCADKGFEKYKTRSIKPCYDCKSPSDQPPIFKTTQMLVHCSKCFKYFVMAIIRRLLFSINFIDDTVCTGCNPFTRQGISNQSCSP